MSASWITELRQALRDEFDDAPWVVTLATIDADGSPDARSVICRRVDDEGTLWVASDARSRKNAQLRERQGAAMVFWLPTLRVQIRVRGGCDVLPSADPQAVPLWHDLTDASRALFLWPAPGEPRKQEDVFPQGAPATAPVPPTFEVIRLWPRLVERLDLAVRPHRRRRWRADEGWREVELNP